MRHQLVSFIAGTLLVLVILVVISSRARAGSSCCAHCGCTDGCQKVCRLVCENKKITTTCWGCQSEDFCVPGPSQANGRYCDVVCNDNDTKAPCVQPKRFAWTEWIPGDAKVYTKKKLMKRTITKTVPSYKWVVEDLCPQCAANSEAPAVPPGTPIPPVPAAITN